jgi:hypothetical protein
MNMSDEKPSEKQLEFHKLSPLPRNIRRLMLKAAIKAGKEPYAEGYEKGYEAAKTLMYETGFRAGYDEAFRDIERQLPAKAAADALVRPVEIGLVSPDGSRLVVNERDDYQPSEESQNDTGYVTVTERT